MSSSGSRPWSTSGKASSQAPSFLISSKAINKAAAEPKRQAAREALAKADPEPHTVTHADLPALNEHLLTLTRDEVREHARGMSE